MYVCICRQVTDRQIREAAAAGCNSVKALGQQTGLGTQCGRCACMARELLREFRSEHHQRLAELLTTPVADLAATPA